MNYFPTREELSQRKTGRNIRWNHIGDTYASYTTGTGFHITYKIIDENVADKEKEYSIHEISNPELEIHISEGIIYSLAIFKEVKSLESLEEKLKTMKKRMLSGKRRATKL